MIIPQQHAAELFFRSMRPSDLDLVVHNESLGYPHPWSRRVFLDCLRAGYECRVLASRDKIFAHGVLSAAAGESHVLTLCVHPDYRGMGYGREMLRHLLKRAGQAGAEVAFLEVRPSNTEAKSLYRSMGFTQIGERKNYYPGEQGRGEREDALILSRPLPLE